MNEWFVIAQQPTADEARAEGGTAVVVVEADRPVPTESTETTAPSSGQQDSQAQAVDAQTPAQPAAAQPAAPTAESSAPTGMRRVPPEFVDILGDIEIPEGVDPSFLAALPEEMRQEVISEHIRLQRLRQRATTQAQEVAESGASGVMEVSPEFLAALPPNIQVRSSLKTN